MRRKEKIYLLIIQHKIVDLTDLEQFTKWKRITVLRTLAQMVFKRQIRVISIDGHKFFMIKDKPL